MYLNVCLRVYLGLVFFWACLVFLVWRGGRRGGGGGGSLGHGVGLQNTQSQAEHLHVSMDS